MDPADIPLALDEKAAHPVTRDSVEVVLTSFERKTDHLDQLFGATGQVLPQPEEALAVLTECIDSDPDRFPVRPEDLIALEVRVFAFSIPGGIATKEED
jgi:hypothetical protein